jgi:DNA polymerase (family 10)
MSLNSELSDLFRTFAQIMEIRGESVFKSIAFSKVSRLLKDMTVDIKKCCDEGTLAQLEGIGASSRKIIEEYVRTGRSADFDDVAKSVPAGLIPMLEIPSLGPKTIALLWKQKNITSIDELKKAIAEKKLDGIKGLGEKKIQSIREGLDLLEKSAGRVALPLALAIGEQVLEAVRAFPGVIRAELTGSLRRRKETIGDLDIVCSVKQSSAGEKITAAFVKLPGVQRVLGQGQTKASVLSADGVQIDLRVVPDVNFGAAVLYFTGSKEHNVRLRGLAQDKGMTLNEWGLYKLDEYDKAEKKTAEAPSAKPVASKTEEDVYKALGLKYIEPEMREDRGEVAAAAADRLPTLLSLADIKGDLHTHTTASDGDATIEEMADAAIRMGYEYLAITDHSRSQVIANGLTAERLMKHVDAIHKADDKIKGIHLLAGCEVDILADGKLDFDDAVLKELDFVVASPHIALKQDSAKATERILRAIDNKYVHVIGHPTGRLIGSREGLPLDFERIFKAAAANGTALEINSGYPRLDLSDLHARAALEAGCKLSINTDAHSTDGLGWMHLGVSVARRAWAPRTAVINCFTWAQLRTFLSAKRA